MNSVSFFEWCFCMLKHLLLFTFLYGGVWYASPSGWTLRQQHSKSGVGFSPRSAAPGSNLPLHGGLLSWENTILIYSEIVRERASEREGKRKVGERELIYEREKSCVCVFLPPFSSFTDSSQPLVTQAWLNCHLVSRCRSIDSFLLVPSLAYQLSLLRECQFFLHVWVNIPEC